MFDRVLIANRGEIAVRIIKTCRRLGLRTAVVYSDADAGSLAVEMADEAVRIGPAPAAQSYLVADAVIAAARATKADAIHPGFGFLSENAAFAKRVMKEKLVWIGPNPAAIEAMGDKITSKKAAAAAGVSVVPGHMGLIKDADHAVKIAREIGYPVMIKASAGGGGKGMRIAHDDAGAREGFQSAKNEAKSSFGDDRVFIEKFVVEPRHIEIQVLGDKHGSVVHLGERECSVQRRNQKVLEEAPSPFIDAATRAAMGAQAVALSKAVDYDSAGTVEFIVDKDRNFYFLEMNTRLQVEHPVTEMTLGLDLVEQMLRSAAGEKLAITQEDVTFKGWAVEARLYAEDPYRGFLPSIGRLTRYRPPAEGPLGDATIRIDAGVREGDQISLYYDPMIAKLIAHAPTRLEAIEGLQAALDRFDIAGIQDNTPFLAAVLGQARFREGRLTTGYIAEEFPDGFSGAEVDAVKLERMIAAAVYAHVSFVRRAARGPGRIHTPPSATRRDWAALIKGDVHAIDAEIATGGGRLSFSGGPARRLATDWTPGKRMFEGRLDGEAFAARIDDQVEGYLVAHAGASLRIIVTPPRAAALHKRLPPKPPADTSKVVASPMPGLVVSVAVKAGQAVKAGEALLVVEAMKMENTIRAERDGVIAHVAVAPGASVSADEELIAFD